MADSILKSYLVRLGYKVDEQQYRNFQESIQKTAKGMGEISKAFLSIGKATVIGLTAAGLGLHKVAEGMAGLYYSAQRTGASAKELKLLEYGFEQIGLSAEQARGSVESLATARRTNPGLNGLLANLGINPKNLDNAQVFVQLLTKLREMSPAIRSLYAQQFGLDEGTVNQVELNGPEFSSAMKRRAAQFQKDGYDPDAASRKAVEFMRQWNEAKASYADMAQTIAVKLLPYADRLIKFLERTADWLEKTDKATGGWVTRLGALAAVLLPILTALKLTGGLSVLSGLGKLAFGGIGAAASGGAAVAEGGGLLGLIVPLIPGIVAAVLAVGAIAAVWYGVTHPEQVKKAWDATKNGLDTFDKSLHDLVDPKAKKLGGDFLGSLAQMTAGFEGFRKSAYRDAAGKLTIGVGHLIRPGEDFSGADSNRLMQVFNEDLLKHVKHVLSVLKVNVNGNQLKALSDLAFNIGDGAFDKSTLLKKLNAGDFAGAADQFAAWNKVHLQPNAALTKRRAAEADLFRAPADGDKSVTVNVKSEFNIKSTDPKAAANEVESRQRGQYADLTRYFAPSFQ